MLNFKVVVVTKKGEREVIVKSEASSKAIMSVAKEFWDEGLLKISSEPLRGQ